MISILDKITLYILLVTLFTLAPGTILFHLGATTIGITLLLISLPCIFTIMILLFVTLIIENLE